MSQDLDECAAHDGLAQEQLAALRARNRDLEVALLTIEKAVKLNWREGEAVYQFAIIARSALDGDSK